jgi:uncharacterized protein (DUF302 family)
MQFGNPVTVNTPFDQTRENTIAAFGEEGFGLITEIDVKETLKQKLDAAFRGYSILGFCNPPFAHEALKRRLDVGLLMPCNVIVYDNLDGTSTISPLNIELLMQSMVPELEDLAQEIGKKMSNAMAKITK